MELDSRNTDGIDMSVIPKRKSKTLARLKKLKAQKAQDQLESENIKSSNSPRPEELEGTVEINGEIGNLVNKSSAARLSPVHQGHSPSDQEDSSFSDKIHSSPVLSSSQLQNFSNNSNATSQKLQDDVETWRTSSVSDSENRTCAVECNVPLKAGTPTADFTQEASDEISSEDKTVTGDCGIRIGQDSSEKVNYNTESSIANENSAIKVETHQKEFRASARNDQTIGMEDGVKNDASGSDDDDLIVIGGSCSEISRPSSSIPPLTSQSQDRLPVSVQQDKKDVSEDEAIGSASSDCGYQPLDQSESVLKYSDISAGNVTYKNQQNRQTMESSVMDLTSSRDELSEVSHPGTSGISSSKRTDCSESDLTERLNSRTCSEPPMGSTDSLTDTNRSFVSTGALPPITTQSARRNKNRSYLMGGVRNTGSLLGREELDRNLPDRKVRVFVSTWNMHEEKVLPDNLEDLVLPEESAILQDIYVVGTQESTPDADEWAIRLQETLGTTHILLHKASLGVLHLLIFIRRDLFWFCSPVEEDSVSTRPGTMIKTKGAVAVSFTFFGTSFLFIVSHFTSGDDNLSHRIQDYAKIIRSLDLPIKVPATRKYNVDKDDITSRFDAVFWCGDFNFRLMETRAKIENWALQLKEGNEDDFSILLEHDQLRKTMKKNSIFKGFQEGEINFLPTYKYNPGEDVFDTSSKARIPSYTDRVLFKPRKAEEVNVLYYNSCPTIRCSDHRPVYGIYEVKVRPGRDDYLCGTPNFAKDVFAEANRRRAAAVTGNKSSSSKSQKSSICSVM